MRQALQLRLQIAGYIMGMDDHRVVDETESRTNKIIIHAVVCGYAFVCGVQLWVVGKQI